MTKISPFFLRKYDKRFTSKIEMDTSGIERILDLNKRLVIIQITSVSQKSVANSDVLKFRPPQDVIKFNVMHRSVWEMATQPGGDSW